MVATSSGGTEMSLNLEAVEGKSYHPECFGFILHLWSLLLRQQEHNGSAHWCGCLGGCVCVCVCGGGGGRGILGACREELQQ
jgi:hypothetical protein